jgi:hypothetical protein
MDLDETITEMKLRANCRFCEAWGAPFKPRPVCATCGSETVELSKECRLKRGDTTWRDLLTWKATCYVCHPDEKDFQLVLVCCTLQWHLRD